MKWIKIFLLFVLLDLKKIPWYVYAAIRRWRVRYNAFMDQKIRVEKSTFFTLLSLPETLIKHGLDVIRARQKGMTPSQFYEAQTKKAEIDLEAMRVKTNRLRLETMERFVEMFPGATINDWNEALEDKRPATMKLLMALILRRTR